jgi:hypothetical protein
MTTHMSGHMSTDAELFYETIAGREPGRAAQTGRDRLRAHGLENGFTWIGGSPQPDIDEFIRGDRIVHVRYAADNHIVDVLVNGQSLFNRDRSVVAHDRAMAAYQRSGIGLVYGDDGHWIADHLHGAEKARAEERADRAWAQTHRHCPRSAQVVGNPTGRLTLYRCPGCDQQVGLDATGKVLPHSVRITT